MQGAEFPTTWDENSSTIVAQKYFFNPSKSEWRKKLEDKIGTPNEKSIRNLISRVSNFLADEGYKLGYFSSKEDRDTFRDELVWLQLNRKGAFNSPVQFNAGIFNEYGVEGSHGITYHRDSNTGEVSKNEHGEYVKPQCHACFIKGPRDDLESIAIHAVHEIGVFALGSGIGQNIGALRGDGEKLSGGGGASGPLSYLDFYDNVAGSIKSGGKSRRAARKTDMNQNHPDIMNFIRAKLKEDKKCLELMKLGYSPGMDGEAARSVKYQNTNLSVRLDDNFFDQLERGGNIDIHYVNTREKVGEVPADQMLKEISFGSWRIGDPGIQYTGEIDKMHTCPNSGQQEATNPCGEYLFLNDTSCNLASLNLLAFADEKGKIDITSLIKAARIFAIAQDIANDSASYPIYDIAEISPEFRTIGLGFANLGGLLMINRLPYDSDKARALAGGLTSIITGAAYETSIELAKNLGTFIHYELNSKPMLDVMKKHQRNLEDIAWDLVDDETLKEVACSSWSRVIENGSIYGFRNAQTTVIAPTGTISYLLGAQDSTGPEPILSLVINKDLAGGGRIKIAASYVKRTLKNLGYKDNDIELIEDYIGQHNKIIGAPSVNPIHYNIFATSFGNVSGEGSIPLGGHIRMMGAIQPFVSGGISKTNNLPETATVKDVYDGYILGKNLHLKGLTIFRSNSKPTSAFNFETDDLIEPKRGEKVDLTPYRDVFESEIKIDGFPFHISVSEYPDGTPGQIAFLCYKAGSTLEAHFKTAGILASKALRGGLSLDTVTDGWLGHEFSPKGLVAGDPFIKTALSPLDYAAKLLRLHYLGEAEMANDPDLVDFTQLRGFRNGAFETYERKKIDDWNFEKIINNPKLGGFVPKKDKRNNPKRRYEMELKNIRGVICNNCGNEMRQTSPNCYECKKCAEKIGGCGM